LSDINRIANLLLEQIRSRQTLAIGTAQSAAIQGTRALYQTPSGIISAIATNFCYDDCLLAKVEGTWYAINPNDNRKVVRSSVDRLIQRKPKIATDRKKVFFVNYNTTDLPVNLFDPSYPTRPAVDVPGFKDITTGKYRVASQQLTLVVGPYAFSELTAAIDNGANIVLELSGSAFAPIQLLIVQESM
jgi:hypothetical protein